ncbi:hypothetical protein [Photorhabdus antumapuensis]|uniref:hypothetical protein n=1 Tax=Photorhabdus antumapuensis TaxID=2862867 RepID=UPI001CED04D7|nr:hypothetical protein [Photorhabdus antumapuensis]MCA6219298.1 hypothetical protein [Photorhabdus antumapuensis]
MRNYFQIKGYDVNKRGLAVGISYQVISSTNKHTTANALQKAEQDGFTHVLLNYAREVAA